ncbi:hypothetical protein KGD83_19650 [Nocardiopsis akebiae]|uniref:Uncharacterized protein n=1 Tax=Nocardiopsis akebiae TaxID=2831968 RepID=A0ABX8C350_9ACTN|nr:hypothetical protein [Nocardiopsis akebiae]QUX27516.1 hypothetical protein KGD83_19650 [Nocardiopsis akebiae]
MQGDQEVAVPPGSSLRQARPSSASVSARDHSSSPPPRALALSVSEPPGPVRTSPIRASGVIATRPPHPSGWSAVCSPVTSPVAMSSTAVVRSTGSPSAPGSAPSGTSPRT